MGRISENYHGQSNYYDDYNAAMPAQSPVQAQSPMAAMPMGGSGNAIQAMYASNPAIAREVATVQCQMLVAQLCPRNVAQVQQRIEAACSRMQLATSAIYAYAKGGTDIQGASIRLAEALINAYGNAKAGFEVTAQTEKESTVRAYAFDMETNTLMERTFVVPHKRDTRSGSYTLTDAREIYEAVANQAARRVRACILAIIPSDLQEYALDRCANTLRKNVNITPGSLASLVEAFSKFGVTKARIEKFIQRKLEAIATSQYIKLQQIYASLRDGMGTADDFFPPEDTPSESEKSPINASKEKNGESVLTQEKNAVQSGESSSETKTATEETSLYDENGEPNF